MNELLQKHGCSNVFTIPEGLKELMADISREVLREQPVKICDFIANYLAALLVTREHGILAVKLLEDLCDCKPSVAEQLIAIGMDRNDANDLSDIIKNEIERVHVAEGKEKVREQEILRSILSRMALDEEMTAKVCEIARNAYRDYWYRKKLLEQSLKEQPDEPWEVAMQHTLAIYKRTKPSFSELTRASLKIQAAYKGYYVRRRMIGLLKPKEPQEPQVDLSGPPLDIAESREIDLGRVVDIKTKVKVDDVDAILARNKTLKHGVGYDTTKTITMTERPSRMVDPKNISFDPNELAKQADKKKAEFAQAPQVMTIQVEGATPFERAATPQPLAVEETVYGDDSPRSIQEQKMSFGDIGDVKDDENEGDDKHYENEEYAGGDGDYGNEGYDGDSGEDADDGEDGNDEVEGHDVGDVNLDFLVDDMVPDEIPEDIAANEVDEIPSAPSSVVSSPASTAPPTDIEDAAVDSASDAEEEN